MNIIIKGARLVDSTMDSRSSVGDIIIENGCISDVVIGDCGIASSENFQIIEANKLIAMPAFVDLHTHFRDPGLTHKEDIESGSQAAVRGGYTTVNKDNNAPSLCKTIEKSAVNAGAEMLITACPLCLYNLEKNTDIPVKYFTELLAEALGVKED